MLAIDPITSGWLVVFYAAAIIAFVYAAGTLRREGRSVRLPKRCARNVLANWPTRRRVGRYVPTLCGLMYDQRRDTRSIRR